MYDPALYEFEEYDSEVPLPPLNASFKKMTNDGVIKIYFSRKMAFP